MINTYSTSSAEPLDSVISMNKFISFM